VVGFFSIASSKLASYVLPAMPALGLLFGAWIDRAFEDETSAATVIRVLRAISLALGGVLALVALIAWPLHERIALWIDSDVADVVTIAHFRRQTENLEPQRCLIGVAGVDLLEDSIRRAKIRVVLGRRLGPSRRDCQQAGDGDLLLDRRFGAEPFPKAAKRVREGGHDAGDASPARRRRLRPGQIAVDDERWLVGFAEGAPKRQA
jgi:hypothetical protein